MNVATAASELPFLFAVHESARSVVHEVKGQCTRLSGLYAESEGFTLAAVLLLGDDDVIGDVCPAYKTDAVFRMSDADRYDDRLVVRTNLIESYDLLSEFARKHLPDRFVLDGGVRKSARDIIVRELVSNLLIHREFMSPFPAKLVIDSGGIRTENASRALYEGRITLSDFNPMPKNPTIADVFAHIGRAEELGSGMRNLDMSCIFISDTPFLGTKFLHHLIREGSERGKVHRRVPQGGRRLRPHQRKADNRVRQGARPQRQDAQRLGARVQEARRGHRSHA